MANADGTLLDFLRRLTPPDGGAPSDVELLGRFAASRDAAAFEALVRRHGPLVWGVCLRLLSEPADAEDAFQAVFLVLARRAGSIGRRELLANWLYGVALRTARKARGLRARRRCRERQVAVMPEPPPPAPPSDPWAELGPVLDAELAGLADKYRRPVLLCYLQGHTRQEAAAALGWPPGTVAGRLARALERLRARLARRGVALPAATLAALLAERATAAVPPALVASVTGAAPAAALSLSAVAASPTAVALAKGTLTAMTTAKLARLLIPALLVAALAVGTAAALAHATAADQAPAAQTGGNNQPTPKGDNPKGDTPKGDTPKGDAKAQEPKRLTKDEATALIRAHLQNDKRNANWLDKLTFKEDTTDELWDKLGAQLFRLDPMVAFPYGDTYVIRNRQVVPLYTDKPAFRFTSYCVADMRRDGKPYLAFTYNWGSGVLRSQVAVINLWDKNPQPLVAVQSLVGDPEHEWRVTSPDGKYVRVDGGKVSYGRLMFTSDKNSGLVLRILLPPDLPEAIRSKIQMGPDPAPKGEQPKGEQPKGEQPKGEQPKGEQPKGEETRRLTMDEASTLIKTYLLDDRRALAFIEKLSFKEETSDALWTRLGAQLFRADQPDGLPFPSVFVVRNKKTVIPITGGQAGFRFVSACVGEVGAGGRPVLAFSYTWGSGVLRGEVGVIDVRAKEPRALIAPEKLVLDPAHEWHVRVAAKGIRIEGGRVEFGELEFVEKDGATVLRLKLRDDLPPEIRKNVQGARPAADEIKGLIHQLGDPQFKNRENASQRLLDAGAAALPACREALNSPEVEIRERARQIIDQIEKGPRKG